MLPLAVIGLSPTPQYELLGGRDWLSPSGYCPTAPWNTCWMKSDRSTKQNKTKHKTQHRKNSRIHQAKRGGPCIQCSSACAKSKSIQQENKLRVTRGAQKVRDKLQVSWDHGSGKNQSEKPTSAFFPSPSSCSGWSGDWYGCSLFQELHTRTQSF